ncbi:hypothetical protein WA171_001548 [Blastocystis sp. BT1]
MAPKGTVRAVYDEEERKKFLLGFHNRKQERKVEYLTKKALRAKQEKVLEKLARKRNLLKRERELGLLDSVSDRKKDKDHLVTSKENIDDEFSKNMFGTEEVTVTVEYEGDENDQNDAELLQDEEQEVENKKDEEDEELNEEEEKILENVTLTENEMRRIREEAGRKRKYKKGKKHRKGRH